MKSSDIVVRAITRCGGIADAGTVIRLTSRHAVSKAVERRAVSYTHLTLPTIYSV